MTMIEMPIASCSRNGDERTQQRTYETFGRMQEGLQLWWRSGLIVVRALSTFMHCRTQREGNYPDADSSGFGLRDKQDLYNPKHLVSTRLSCTNVN